MKVLEARNIKKYYGKEPNITKALDGVDFNVEKGEFVAIVRKAKGNYFLGAATNEKPRTLEIKLDFLKPGKQYKAVINADGEKAD